MKINPKIFLQAYLVITGALFFLLGSGAYVLTAVYVLLMIVCAVGVGLWGIGLWRHGLNVLHTRFDWGLLALVGAIVISAVFSLDPSRSWRIGWGWLAAIISFQMFVTLLRTDFSTADMGGVLFGFVSAFVLLGIAELVSKWQADLPIGRISAGTGSANIVGLILAIALLLCMNGLIYQKEKRSLFIAALAVCTPLFLLTRSSGAFVSFSAGLVVLAGIVFRPQLATFTAKIGTKAMWITGLISSIAAVTLAVWLWPVLAQDPGLRDRLDIWETAIFMWRSRPLTGTGIHTFASFFNGRHAPTVIFQTAHNWWLNIIAEMGMIGGLASVLLWWQLFRFLKQHQDSDGWPVPAKGLFAALAAFTVQNLVETPSFWMMGLGGCLLAMFIVLLEPQPAERSSSSLSVSAFPTFVWPVLGVVLLAFGLNNIRLRNQFDTAVSLANDGDWSAAADRFDRMLIAGWIRDSSVLYGSAMAHGMLAAESDEHRERAISQFQELIGLEPSWAANHANLGWLYRLRGDELSAADAFAEAHRLNPKRSIYALNGALISESEGLLQQAFDTRRTWHTAPFWAESAERRAVAAEAAKRPCLSHPQAGCAQAINEDWTAALEPFVAADLSVDEQDRQLNLLLHQTPAGFSGRGFDSYSKFIFSRPALIDDFLPGVICFTVDDNLAWQLGQLEAWYIAQGREDLASEVRSAVLGPDGRGIGPCAIRPLGL